MKSNIIFCVLSIAYFHQSVSAQTIYPLQDSNGHVVKIDRNSNAYYEEIPAGGHVRKRVAFFTHNREDNKNNVLVVDEVDGLLHTYWLFDNGFDRQLHFSGFRELKHDKSFNSSFYFQLDSAWYVSDWTQVGSRLFYDGSQINGNYYIKAIYNCDNGLGKTFYAEAYDIDNDIEHLLINYMGTTQLFVFGGAEDIKEELHEFQMLKHLYSGGGDYDIVFGRTWNPDIDDWGNPTVLQVRDESYFEYLFEYSGEQQLIDISYIYGPENHTNFIFYFQDTIAAIFYNAVTDTLIDKTNLYSEDESLVDISYMYNIFNGERDRVYYLIKRRDDSGKLKNYYYDNYQQTFTFDHIHSEDNNDLSQVYRDTYLSPLMYWYDRNNDNYGFTSYNLETNQVIRDEIGMPIPIDFKLSAFDDYVYYAYYDNNKNEFYAAFVDAVEGERVNIIEGQNGMRVKNPRVVHPVTENEIIIQSVVGDSVELLVYRPEGSVAVNETELVVSGYSAYPNPCSEYLEIQLNENANLASEFLDYKVVNISGRCQKFGKVNVEDERVVINLSELPDGMYFLTLSSDNVELSPYLFVKI